MAAASPQLRDRLHVIGNHIAYQPAVFTTNQFGCDVVADCDDKYQNATSANTWNGLWHINPNKRQCRVLHRDFARLSYRSVESFS